MAQKCQEKSKSTLFYWSNGYHLSITPNAYSINQSKSTLKVDSHQITQQHTIYMAKIYAALFSVLQLQSIKLYLNEV